MRYMNVDLNDAEGVDIMCHFAKTNRFLMKCKRLGGKALVHCRAGVSRSTSITCAFLMFNETWRLCDSIDYCRKKRFIIDPNIDFRLQLALYEMQHLRCEAILRSDNFIFGMYWEFGA